jgi:hypothetical protein
MALKSRWHKINSAVQKFVGCYKQAVTTQKSGSSESDVILAANTTRKKENSDSQLVALGVELPPLSCLPAVMAAVQTAVVCVFSFLTF